MIKVMMVCHGNICRSTMAEFVLKDMVKKQHIEDKFIIDSSATSREEIGNGVHHGTRRKLAEMGVPCGEHRAVQITKKDYDNYDYILIMDANNRRNLMRIIGADTEGKVHGLLDFSGRPRDIADPWYTGNFDVTYDDIVEGCEGFLNSLQEKGWIKPCGDIEGRKKEYVITAQGKEIAEKELHRLNELICVAAGIVGGTL